MDRILILNASPRAPRSNSKRYGELFAARCSLPAEAAAVTRTNHEELCRKLEDFSQVLLVFPLYADGIPVTLLRFLESLEAQPPARKPTVSVLINCGFLEYRQNDVAVEMVRLFCRRNGYPFGSVLKIGSGEAILDSPFRFLVDRAVKKLAASVAKGEPRTFHTTMPLPKKLFVSASANYWINYGKKNGVTKAQMETMAIEE